MKSPCFYSSRPDMYVSLFTREWIEIVWCKKYTMQLSSPSLRGSGLKCRCCRTLDNGTFVSLFTREWIEIILPQEEKGAEAVSLFTREWIEMQNRYCRYDNIKVSLFTREWIEIACSVRSSSWSNRSPSLRGSGLKSVLG